jgi:hypothetical protein
MAILADLAARKIKEPTNSKLENHTLKIVNK